VRGRNREEKPQTRGIFLVSKVFPAAHIHATCRRHGQDCTANPLRQRILPFFANVLVQPSGCVSGFIGAC
jgi:hypothetical protein